MSFNSKHVLLLNDYHEGGGESSTDPELLYNTPPSYVSITQQPQVVDHPPDSLNRPSENGQPPINLYSLPVTNQPSRNVINTTSVTSEQPIYLWRNGVFDCCADASVCLCVCLFPCCYACSISRRLSESNCLLCCPGGLAILRYKYRTTNQIQGSTMDDVCLAACCHSCVLCQLGNELNAKQEKYPHVCCGCC